MESKRTAFFDLLSKYLVQVEVFFIVVLLSGSTLRYFSIDPNGLIKVSLTGLAIVFFLYAYRPPKIDPASEEKIGMAELFIFAVLPKVIWIGISVSMIGILFYYLHLGNTNYKSMLIIASSAIGFSIVLQILSLWSDRVKAAHLSSILYRSIPVLLIDLYLLSDR